MRKILITFAIVVALVVAAASGWIFAGRQLSLFLDRFWTVEKSSARVQALAYEGSGSGGVLRIGDLGLSLNSATGDRPPPSVGSTKDGQLALAADGKVFAFGPLPKTADDSSDVMTTAPPAGDDALVSIGHSALSWPTPFAFNFMTGQSPSWKRHLYQRLTWKKASGAKLEMVWRYEQYFYAQQGWTNGLMTGEGATGLVHISIQP